MNLTFIFDGYIAETALEQTFELFCFDGYLIYGDVPPPPSEDGVPAPLPLEEEGGRWHKPKKADDDAEREQMTQDENDWLDILSIFMRVNRN